MKKSNRTGFRITKFLLSFFSIALLLTAVATVFYCHSLSIQIDKRFSARKWSIPSKVYSDTVLLYPGRQFHVPALLEKLDRLEYQRVSGTPKKRGEYAHENQTLMVYLHELKMPERQRESLLVRVSFENNRIVSIKNDSDNTPMGLLEIEPEEIMLFFGPERERRQLISIDQVPDHVIHAVLAAEDSQFFSHKGFDYKGILRAFWVNLRHGAIKQGGSTITQQLVKNYFLTPERSYARKLKELCMSVTMEIMYEKNEILEIYLNEIYLGQKGNAAINGMGEASYFYFDKPVSDLSIAEAAAIAGLIRGPNRYSPYVNLQRSQNRRNQVLKAMHENGWIDEMRLHASMGDPVAPAGYRAYGRKAPYFMDYLTNQLKTLYSGNDLSSLGLSVYTTLDTEVQNAAEAALENGLTRLEARIPALKKSNPESRLQGAVIVMQPQTGNILAMVGGRNYDVSQFNRAVQARRQPGSAFKPFVYAAGLDRYTPASLLSNVPRVWEMDGTAWEPKNFMDLPDTEVRMRTALARSINIATVELAMSTGLDKIAETAEAFGFSTLETIYPSVALGAIPVVPLELARAYCPFAANGMLPFPLSLKEVADENDKLLERRPTTISRALSAEHAFLVHSMLQSAVAEGTGSSLKHLGITYPVSGKTGTTNNYRDAWFIGFTQDILALVWIGFDNGAPVKSSGAAAALPVWADLMSRIPQHVSGGSPIIPHGIVKKVVCAKTGMLALEERCPESIEEFFEIDHDQVPAAFCPAHRRSNPFRQVIHGFRDIFIP